MKKLLLLLVVIAGALFFLSRNGSEGVPQNVQTNTGSANPNNATFSFDDGSVTLSSGRGEKEDEESEFTESVELLPENAKGDLNADGKDDTVVLLARSGGGSGVFIYIAAYVSGPVNYKGTNAIFIGDRVSPESISVSNGVVTFEWLDRRPDEPFAAEPTVPASEQFVYQNGSFRER